jgi:hypothetical protein
MRKRVRVLSGGRWITVLKSSLEQKFTEPSADDFAAFLRDMEKESGRQPVYEYTMVPPAFSGRSAPDLIAFVPATVTQIVTLLSSSASKSCDLDPIPIWLLKRLSTLVAPVICHLCNLTLNTGVFPSPLKQARVLTLQQQKIATESRPRQFSLLDFYKLSFISKLVERVVAKRFTSFATNFSLFPSNQSSYGAHALSAHDDPMRAVNRQGTGVVARAARPQRRIRTVDHPGTPVNPSWPCLRHSFELLPFSA